jgi:uncharacterized protein YcfJ
MNKTLLAAALVSALGCVASTASAQAFGDVARVISATPLYERASVPRRDCRVEPVTAYEERRTETRSADSSGGIGAGTVLGAIVGGVIGHQFGGSSAGRDHGTAAGAVIGGLVGNQVERDANSAPDRDVVVDRVPVTREVERCNTVPETRERIVGYDVRYEYNGRELRTRLPYDPGQEMPVNVEVRPPGASMPGPGPRAPAYRGTY